MANFAILSALTIGMMLMFVMVMRRGAWVWTAIFVGEGN